MGCGWWNHPTAYKEDCYWYREEQDMNARIPYCLCTNQFPLDSCENCEDYHSRSKRTQGDRIRQWSDEEIAEFTIGVMDGAFELFTGAKMPDEKRRAMKTEWIDWLRKEVDDDNNS